MWSRFLVCCLIGLAAASGNGWQTGREYIYKVRGRTLTGLHELAEQYAGIVMRANLVIQPKSESTLLARIVNPQYAQIHSELPEGWNSEIPSSKLHYEDLRINNKPFEIKLRHGVIESIVVDQDISNLDANIIKSFVSQFQLDIYGQNAIESSMNQIPDGDDTTGYFKTMEDSITGKYQTVYDIAPLPKYVLLSQPWLATEINKEDQIFEVVKNKNFSDSEERLGYYYGMGDIGNIEPNTNQMGSFFSRSSVSRVILSGSLKKYTIQSSSTTNKIIVSPTLNTEQKGMVVSFLNITLDGIHTISNPIKMPSAVKTLYSLTYSFNTPFEREENRERFSRSQHANQESIGSTENEEEWAQEAGKLNEPPQSPLLPYYVGYKGRSIKEADRINVVKTVESLVREIAEAIQNPDNIPKEQTLTKYVIVSSLVRIMSEQEMKQVVSALYSKKSEGIQATAWYVYRDVLAESGTAPALLTIQELIVNKQIEGELAAEVIATMADSVRQPSEEYIRTFYEFATKEKRVYSQRLLNDTALLSFTDLVRKVYVDTQVSHNQYPVPNFQQF